MNWVMIIPLVIMAYMIIKIIALSKRNTLNRKMLNVLDTFSNDPDGKEFYEKCDEYLNTETNVEYLNKVRVLRLWADAYHGNDEDFAKDLELIDLNALIVGDGKGKNGNQIELNEDSFFYLYLAIPNRLYFRGDKKDAEQHYAKLESIHEQMDVRLVKNVGDACRKYYDHVDDLGKAFFQKVIDGDYGEYKYSKELIGIYKNIVSSMLARIALDDGNNEEFENHTSELKSFANSNLGRRFLKELAIELPEEEEADNSSEEETKAIADDAKAEEAEPADDEVIDAEVIEEKTEEAPAHVKDISEPLKSSSDEAASAAEAQAQQINNMENHQG